MDEIRQAFADASLNRTLEDFGADQIEAAIMHLETVLLDRDSDERLAAADSLHGTLRSRPSTIVAALRSVADVLADHIVNGEVSA